MPYDMQYQGGSGGWFVMAVAMILLWSLGAVAIVAAVRHFSHHAAHDAVGRGPRATDPTSVETLKMRLAQGEIDETEFSSRLHLLQSTK